MATTVDDRQRAQDAEEHRRSYRGIMTAATHYGVPLALALTAFFTALTARFGLGWAFIALFGVYFFSWWIVRTFFSSH